MSPRQAFPVLEHGGDLTAARTQFPNAPEPFIDLSTGINPFSYPCGEIPAHALTRLPEPADVAWLAAIAAKTYGAPSPEHLVPAPGMQILLPMVAALVASTRAAVLTPTYAEHARAAALAGHKVQEVCDVAELAQYQLAVVVNPNNPDGRILGKSELLEVAKTLRARGGLLIVDEAFMDVGPREESLAGEAANKSNLVVLRSFGKFFGLPGVRLGFALTAPERAARLAALLGPWALSAPALAIGQVALADEQWAQAMRERLRHAASRLDALLIAAGLEVVGGTSLFRLARAPAAADVFDRLGRAGIFVRRFAEWPNWLRFGLPGDEEAWSRLATALAA
jgi:cobalamin biosynthesis protein CobC